jgi:hypothetical protein
LFESFWNSYGHGAGFSWILSVAPGKWEDSTSEPTNNACTMSASHYSLKVLLFDSVLSVMQMAVLNNPQA